jgi:hypothetical protein
MNKMDKIEDTQSRDRAAKPRQATAPRAENAGPCLNDCTNRLLSRPTPIRATNNHSSFHKSQNKTSQRRHMYTRFVPHLHPPCDEVGEVPAATCIQYTTPKPIQTETSDKSGTRCQAAMTRSKTMNDQMAVLLTALVVAMENSIARGSPEEAQRDIPTTAL